MEIPRFESEPDIDPSEVFGEKIEKSKDSLEEERIQEKAVEIAKSVIPEVDPYLEATAEAFFFDPELRGQPWHRVRFKRTKPPVFEWSHTFNEEDLNPSRVKKIIKIYYDAVTGGADLRNA